MLIGKTSEIPSSSITPQDQYLNRRSFLRNAASATVAAGVAALGAERLGELFDPSLSAFAGTKLQTVPSQLTTSGETLTSYKDVTSYNNFYEFGVDKGQPVMNAGALPTRPWTIRIEGLVKKPKLIDIEALLKFRPLEERVYRHRCV